MLVQSCQMNMSSISIYFSTFSNNVFEINHDANFGLNFNKITLRYSSIGENVWKIKKASNTEIKDNGNINFCDLNLNTLSTNTIFYFFNLSLNEMSFSQNEIFMNILSE